MTYILCLAHYCDIHGPTPLMVTEGLPTACSVCYEEGSAKNDAPRSSPTNQEPHIVDALRNVNLNRSPPGVASPKESQSKRASMQSTTAASANSNPNTPPESPRPAFQQLRRGDSGFRRTYDETVTKKQGPCDNCSMTLPRRQTSANGSEDSITPTNAPTLRTRAPAERVYGSPIQLSSPARSQTSSDTDGERDASRRPRSRIAAQSVSSRTTSCSSTSTTSDTTSNVHVHYVDYTSTHEPVLANSFSLVRASCLRALSFETLPRAPSTATPNSSPQINSSPSFITTQSAGSAATGGPIFFGDPLAGFTTAYIFRIPDVHARGHKRVYAFLALSTHRERLAMKTFAVLSTAFKEMATWIQQLAETEAERSSEPSQSHLTNGPVTEHSTPVFEPATNDRSGSSFLTGGIGAARRLGGGAGISSLKARGLAELVGQPDFFIQLHKKFVQLLFEVGVTLSS